MATLPAFVAVPTNPFTSSCVSNDQVIAPPGAEREASAHRYEETEEGTGPPSNPPPGGTDAAVTSTAATTTAPHQLITRSSNTAESRAIASRGTQSVWPQSEEDTDDSGGFGYATVRHPLPFTGVNGTGAGVRYPAVVTESVAGIGPSAAGMKTEPAIRSSPPTGANQDSPRHGRPLPSLPVGELRSTTRAASPPATGGPRTGGKQKLEPVSNRDSPIAATGTTHTIIRDITFSPGGAVALYTRVNKSATKSSPSKADKGSALPPKAPSGLTRKGQHSESPNSELKPVEYHHDKTTAGPAERKSGATTADITGVKKNHPGYLSWDGAEYTDEEYLPSGDDTFSITDTNYSDEELMLQNLHSDVTPPRHPKTPNQKPSPVYRQRSSTPNQLPNVAGESLLSPRPNSAPLPENIPFIQPSFIQRVTPTQPRSQPPPGTGANGEVYIFSEKQLDGSVQYYTATPVHSPLITKHPLSTPPSLLIQQPATSGTSHTPSTPPLIQQPATPTLMVPSHAHAQFGSRTVLESGYCSNPATFSPTYTSIPKHHQQLTSPPDDTRNSVAGDIRGTRITKLGSSIHNSSGAKAPLVPRTDQRDFVGLPVAGVSDNLREWKARSYEEDTDVATGLPIPGVNRDFKQKEETERCRASGETVAGAKVKLRLHVHPERTPLEHAGAGIVFTAGKHHESDTFKLRERIRSLTADNAALGQQLTREQTQHRITEVRGIAM